MCRAVCQNNSVGFQRLIQDLQNPFRNANKGQYNAHLDAPQAQPTPNQGGLSLSPDAYAFMQLASAVVSLQNGPFAMLMGMLGSLMNGALGQLSAGQMGVPMTNPGFGENGLRGGRCSPNCSSSASSVDAPKVAAGQTKELKEGETVRGANGTLLTWGKGDNVDVKYKDKNGQMKSISVKDGMISFDGGAPKKLQNTGQLLRLPNGDVIGLGNQQAANGAKDLCRVVMADSADKVACSPPSATSIYDVEELERRYTSMEGGGISMNVSSASFQTPYGVANFASTSMNVFLGHPVTRVYNEQVMRLVGVK